MDDLPLHVALDAFTGGYAQARHFNNLLDSADATLMAAHHRDAHGVVEVCHIARAVLLDVQTRFLKTGKLGVTGDELAALKTYVEVQDDWWNRQPGELLDLAKESLATVRSQQSSCRR